MPEQLDIYDCIADATQEPKESTKAQSAVKAEPKESKNRKACARDCPGCYPDEPPEVPLGRWPLPGERVRAVVEGEVIAVLDDRRWIAWDIQAQIPYGCVSLDLDELEAIAGLIQELREIVRQNAMVQA